MDILIPHLDGPPVRLLTFDRSTASGATMMYWYTKPTAGCDGTVACDMQQHTVIVTAVLLVPAGAEVLPGRSVVARWSIERLRHCPHTVQLTHLIRGQLLADAATPVTILAIGFVWRSLRDQIREVNQRLNDTNTHLLDVVRRLARVEGVLSVQQAPAEADSQ